MASPQRAPGLSKRLDPLVGFNWIATVLFRLFRAVPMCHVSIYTNKAPTKQLVFEGKSEK